MKDTIAVILSMSSEFPEARADALRNAIDCAIVDLACRKRELQALLDLAARIGVTVPNWAP